MFRGPLRRTACARVALRPRTACITAGVLGLTVGLAACGSGGSTTSAAQRTTAPAASPSTTTTTITHTTSSPPAPRFARPIHATLVGRNHHPRANKLWPYTVTATDAGGRPLPGTVDIEFTFHGVVVGHDTPPTHDLDHGRWHDNLTFPSQAVGQTIALQAVVHTSLGSVTLDWPVTVGA